MGGRLGPVAHLLEHRQGHVPVPGFDRGSADDLAQLERHVADPHPGCQIQSGASRGERDLGVIGNDEPGQVVAGAQLGPDEIESLRVLDRTVQVVETGLRRCRVASERCHG